MYVVIGEDAKGFQHQLAFCPQEEQAKEYVKNHGGAERLDSCGWCKLSVKEVD